jgi:hypothetical protein
MYVPSRLKWAHIILKLKLGALAECYNHHHHQHTTVTRQGEVVEMIMKQWVAPHRYPAMVLMTKSVFAMKQNQMFRATTLTRLFVISTIAG